MCVCNRNIHAVGGGDVYETDNFDEQLQKAVSQCNKADHLVFIW